MKKIVFVNDQPMTFAEVSAEYGIPQNTLRTRAGRLSKTQRREHKGQMCPVFTERQLSPVKLNCGGRPTNKKIEDKPVLKELHAIYNKAFGVRA